MIMQAMSSQINTVQIALVLNQLQNNINTQIQKEQQAKKAELEKKKFQQMETKIDKLYGLWFKNLEGTDLDKTRLQNLESEGGGVENFQASENILGEDKLALKENLMIEENKEGVMRPEGMKAESLVRPRKRKQTTNELYKYIAENLQITSRDERRIQLYMRKLINSSEDWESKYGSKGAEFYKLLDIIVWYFIWNPTLCLFVGLDSWDYKPYFSEL